MISLPGDPYVFQRMVKRAHAWSASTMQPEPGVHAVVSSTRGCGSGIFSDHAQKKLNRIN